MRQVTPESEVQVVTAPSPDPQLSSPKGPEPPPTPRSPPHPAGPLLPSWAWVLSRTMEDISWSTPRIPARRCSTNMSLTLMASVPVMASWCWTCGPHQIREQWGQDLPLQSASGHLAAPRLGTLPLGKSEERGGPSPSYVTGRKPRLREADELACRLLTLWKPTACVSPPLGQMTDFRIEPTLASHP